MNIPLNHKWQNVSLIHGTHRYEDLIPVFCDFIRTHSNFGAPTADLAAQIYNNYLSGNYSDEYLGYCVNEILFDTIDTVAPVGYYFGAHPGDGSDYGFWEVDEC